MNFEEYISEASEQYVCITDYSKATFGKDGKIQIFAVGSKQVCEAEKKKIEEVFGRRKYGVAWKPKVVKVTPYKSTK